TCLGRKYRIMKGGHPVPSGSSINGAKSILSLLDRAGEEDLVIFLISGGGSALMTLPVNGIDLETFQEFSNAVLGCGADIREFNTLRKHLDDVKGGRLSLHAAPARQITLILSDVVGNSPDIIASGPTVPDPTTYRDALGILDKYAHGTVFPAIIRETLELGAKGLLPETLKQEISGSSIFLLASNRTAAYAAAECAEKNGWNSRVLNTRFTGDAAAAGELLPSFFSETEKHSVLIFGGETTVRLQGNGLGGRNLQLALASVRPMAEWADCTLVTLATDGEDGPTDAAGAAVTSETLSKAAVLGLDPDNFLRNNDSYHFFEKIGGLIKTGSSGTNVNDLTILIKD
ncbi:MAG: DUF4147 domain-containing protein, partial [Anaerolineaceae bacterium]|nr:DUF4147 domain-containing protein [Anaerolineaceae bacterium]